MSRRPWKTNRPPKNESSAEAEHAPEELRARVRQLAADYGAAFHRKPTEENLQTGALLRAIGEFEELRRKLYERRTSWLHKKVGAHHASERWVWVLGARTAAQAHDGDPETVARVLILTMPLPMRAKCKYPTNEAELEDAVSKVLAARNFKRRVAEWHTGEQDVLKVARAILRGLGMTKDDAKSLVRVEQWEAWVRENPWCGDGP